MPALFYDGFKELPHGNKGRIAASSVLDGYTDQLNELLKAGITNSSALISEPGKLRLREQRTLNIRRKVIGRQLLFPKVTGNNRLYGLTP